MRRSSARARKIEPQEKEEPGVARRRGISGRRAGRRWLQPGLEPAVGTRRDRLSDRESPQERKRAPLACCEDATQVRARDPSIAQEAARSAKENSIRHRRSALDEGEEVLVAKVQIGSALLLVGKELAVPPIGEPAGPAKRETPPAKAIGDLGALAERLGNRADGVQSKPGRRQQVEVARLGEQREESLSRHRKLEAIGVDTGLPQAASSLPSSRASAPSSLGS